MIKKISIIFSIIWIILLSIIQVNAQISSPTVYWKFDSVSSGMIIDTFGMKNLTFNQSRGNLNYGKLNNSAHTNSTANGGTVFNTTNGRELSFDQNNFTVAFWINGTNYSGSYVIMENTESNAAGWGINKATGGVLEWVTGGSVIFSITSTELINSSWNRIVISREGTAANQVKVYVNNRNFMNTTLATNYSLTTGTFNIGGPNGGAGIFLDDLRIYNSYSWNLSDVSSDWNSGNGNEVNRTVNTTSAVQVSLIYPSSGFLITSTNLTFSANISASNSNVTNSTLYIWLSNNTLIQTSINTTTANENASVVHNYTILNLTLQTNSIWNVYGCSKNASGFSNCSFGTNRTFSVGAGFNSITYNLSVYETSRQRFYASFNLVPGTEISQVQLVYNGTNHSVSDYTTSNDILNISKEIDIELLTTPFSNQTKNFFFRFTFSGSVTQESDVFQQNVSFINLQSCNATYTINALNFTLVDEKTQNNISAAANLVTYQSSFSYWLGSGSVYKNYSFQIINSSAQSSFPFCIFPFPSNHTFKTNHDAAYSAIAYSPNNYYLRNATLSNVTSRINLYLMPTSDSTKFYINIRQGINFVEGAVVTISKNFVGEGQYKTVAIKLTDANGQFPLYGDIDQSYRFSIVKDGVLLGIVDRVLACAAAPCEIDINLESGVGSIYQAYDEDFASSVLSNLSFNSTSKIVTYQFVDLTGLAQSFRLLVQKISLNSTNGTVICDSTSFSTFGSITCNVTGYEGDFIATAYISRSPPKIDQILSFIINPQIFQELGFFAILLNVVILVTVLICAAVLSKGDPSVVLFMLGLALLLMKIGGILIFGWITLSVVEVILIYIILKNKT